MTRIESPFIRCFPLDIPVTTLVYHNSSTDGKLHRSISLVKGAAFLVAKQAGLYVERRHQVRLACAGVAHQHEVLVLVVDGRLGGYAADLRASAS